MITEVLLGVFLLFVLFKYINKKPEGLPPGEWGWPVIGQWMPSGITMEEHARNLQRKYGDIFTWRMGSRTMVFLSNFSLIKEAFNHPNLNDRPDFFTFDSFTLYKKVGISNSNGIIWHNSRRFALRQLRDLGMGRSSLMDAIHDEVMHMVEDFKKHCDKPQPIPWSLNVAVLNVIWKMTADRRFEVDDPKIHEFYHLITDAFEATQGNNMLFDMMPWLQYVAPYFVRKRLGVEFMLESFGKIRKYVIKVIEEHEATLDPSNPRDFIDIYLVEIEAQRNNPQSTLSKHDLWVQVADFFTAGSETTNQTLRWVLMYLAKYPEAQARAQREIDEVVDRDHLPSLDDKPKLPYLEAVIMEVSRIVSLFPLGLSHFAAEDSELAGYKIPKGAVIVPNQETCHYDPKYWKKPNEFYPEHFLDKDGKCLSRKESFLPFSIGRRVCPGEGLARMELYLFLSALLQNFTFSEPEGEPLDLRKDPHVILFNFPKPLNVVITRRK